MSIVEWTSALMVRTGAEWVMWLMIGLSVISITIIIERALFFRSLRDNLHRLARDLRTTLDESIEAAQDRMKKSPSAEAAVVVAGLSMADEGPEAAEEAMHSATALQRTKLERRLAFLSTLGSNAPFVGLFGTVIGIVGAFEALGAAAGPAAASQALAPTAVMSNIGEALVATAVGIAVAIPAVAANNYFQRQAGDILANTEALSHVLLAHLKSRSVRAEYAEPAGAE